MGGGPPGDLYAVVKVRPHPVFERDGDDLTIEAPISIIEAVDGATIEIPTIEGRVQLRVPPGTDSHAKLRLRGKGVPHRDGKGAGDLYVRIRIRVPKELDEDARKKLAELMPEEPTDMRRDLFR
jgi:DnaJ-class molecular chaperone